MSCIDTVGCNDWISFDADTRQVDGLVGIYDLHIAKNRELRKVVHFMNKASLYVMTLEPLQKLDVALRFSLHCN